MSIEIWYNDNYEDQLRGRYITLKMVEEVLLKYKNDFKISSAGSSENGQNIPMITFGKGSIKILAWSQMHGNEATTTKALFDFFKFCFKSSSYTNEVEYLLGTYTFTIIPMLNPDGAEVYSRFNANEIDLNRDAKNLSQSESRALNRVFNFINPDLCLNLHDQRSIYGFDSGNSATVSFLSPAANVSRSITKARRSAMEDISRIATVLQKYIPGKVGRYDDTFNENCVGDCFSQKGVPTILFEAGHYGQDYDREKSREFIFYALLALLHIDKVPQENISTLDYLDLPENRKNYYDVILTNISQDNSEKTVSIALQYHEELVDTKIFLKAKVEKIGNLSGYFAHKFIDATELKIVNKESGSLPLIDDVLHIVNNNGEKVPYFL